LIPTQRLAIELFQAARGWRGLLDERLKPHGATKAGWVLLYWLSLHPEGLTQVELAEKAGVEASTMTRLLDGLQADGLIERLPVPGDRRAKRVRLTPQTPELVRRLNAVVEAVVLELFAAFPEEEIELAAGFLGRLNGRLR
jgi:MarR family transcriptional regulator for hemolysin